MFDTPVTPSDLKSAILRHLTFTLGKDAPNASVYDWRMALSYALRDRIVEPWFASTRRTWAEDRKRVYYLSMEFLIGRILEDATINLGLRDVVEEAMQDFGQDFRTIVEDEPDAALGNGGLGRLAACFMESMATLGCPAYGYGIRYEHGLFRQRFEGGQQVETPEDWLTQRHPWEFERPESAYTIGFKGYVDSSGGKELWVPGETVLASAHDTPVVGWQGKWANTLRLWGAKPTTLFDLERFNRGDYAAAAEPEALARTLSRVLYPDDTTYQGKELRLKQEFFLTSAALQDILRRFLSNHSDLRALPKHVAIQMNDTHPAIAGPELIRLLTDVHGMRRHHATSDMHRMRRHHATSAVVVIIRRLCRGRRDMQRDRPVPDERYPFVRIAEPLMRKLRSAPTSARVHVRTERLVRTCMRTFAFACVRACVWVLECVRT